MRRLLVIGAVFALVCGAASAAVSTNPADIQTAKAEGDKLLADANAQDLFVNETGQDGRAVIRLRHKLSGFVCIMAPGAKANRLSVYNSVTRGEDVGCATGLVDTNATLFLFRRPESTAAQDVKVEETNVLRELPDGKPGPVQTLPPDGGAPQHLDETLTSSRLTARLVLGKVGDWTVEYMVNTPKAASTLDIYDGIWTGTVVEGLHYRAANPQASTTAAPTPANPPLNPDQLHALGDQLIARAGAGDFYENVSDDKGLKLRQKATGFVCGFNAGQPDNTLALVPAAVKGDDSNCHTRELGATIDYYVTKRPQETTPEQALALYTADIQRVYPNAAPASGTFANASNEGPIHLSRRLTYQANGTKVFSRLSVAVVGGWVIEQRITAPWDDAKNGAVDLLGEIEMTTGLSKLVGGPADPATA